MENRLRTRVAGIKDNIKKEWGYVDGSADSEYGKGGTIEHVLIWSRNPMICSYEEIVTATEL